MKIMDSQVEVEMERERPTKFTPEWPPKPSRTLLPKVFSKCSEKFKKVEWPPKDDEEQGPNDGPPTTIQLMDQMELNEEAMRPCGTYHLAPTIYAEQPASLDEDVWPPPEPFDLSEKVIHDASRPKRVIRDYTVHFEKNKAPDAGKAYKVPPGTLHVISQRGVLSYDNVDIGRGVLAEPGGPRRDSYNSDSSL